MELVQQGVNTEDAEYQKLYGVLSPEKRDLVDSARRMLPKLQIEDDARAAAAAIREAVAPGGSCRLNRCGHHAPLCPRTCVGYPRSSRFDSTT